ncbi:actin organization and endocytosis protein [Lobaria immixta]|nr:actin organization and endocytosis protein [Lobaria immixta]
MQFTFLTPEDQLNIENAFVRATENHESIDAGKMRELLRVTKLPKRDIKKICTLSDVTKSGRLRFGEFAYAIYLSKLRSSGEALPDELPSHIRHQVSHPMGCTNYETVSRYRYVGMIVIEVTSSHLRLLKLSPRSPSRWMLLNTNHVSVDRYSIVVTLTRLSSHGSRSVVENEFLKEITEDFSAIATATAPVRHVESVQQRSAREPIRLKSHVAKELSELHEGDNVLFILEGDEAASTNVEHWRESGNKLSHLKVDLAVAMPDIADTPEGIGANL